MTNAFSSVNLLHHAKKSKVEIDIIAGLIKEYRKFWFHFLMKKLNFQKLRKTCITTSSLPPPFPLLFKIWLPISSLLPILSKKSYPTPTSQSNLASFREVNSSFMKEGTILMQNNVNHNVATNKFHYRSIIQLCYLKNGLVNTTKYQHHHEHNFL